MMKITPPRSTERIADEFLPNQAEQDGLPNSAREPPIQFSSISPVPAATASAPPTMKPNAA